MAPRSGESLRDKIMADETLPPPGAPGQPDRRRPAPTIDLKATEIASREIAGDAPPAAAAPDPEPVIATPSPDDTAARTPPKSAAHRSLSALAASMSWPLVGAGIAGALVALGIVGVVAWATDRGSELDAAAARIAQLERQVADLAGRAPAEAANAARARDLADRLQKLEAQTTAQAAAAPRPDPALAGRTAAAEAQLKSLGETLGALAQRSDRAAAANAAALSELTAKLARADPPGSQSSEAANAAAAANAAMLATLANRIDALEEGAKGAQDKLAAEVATRVAESADDRGMRTAVIAGALLAAVERGDPFAAELKAARQHAADAEALAPLESFAASGVPGTAALARELASLEPALRQAAGAAPPEGGFLEKLQANAERLVRIRPVEEVAGDDPSTIIARAQIKAERGDVAGALMELGTLAASVRAPAQAWIAKAQAREAAVAASRGFAAAALAALVRPPR
jgi:hypothetical protein